MEIYNEKVMDLLDFGKTAPKAGLRVREHSVLGPYVEVKIVVVLVVFIIIIIIIIIIIFIFIILICFHVYPDRPGPGQVRGCAVRGCGHADGRRQQDAARRSHENERRVVALARNLHALRHAGLCVVFLCVVLFSSFLLVLCHSRRCFDAVFAGELSCVYHLSVAFVACISLSALFSSGGCVSSVLEFSVFS